MNKRLMEALLHKLQAANSAKTIKFGGFLAKNRTKTREIKHLNLQFTFDAAKIGLFSAKNAFCNKYFTNGTPAHPSIPVIAPDNDNCEPAQTGCSAGLIGFILKMRENSITKVLRKSIPPQQVGSWKLL